MQKNIVHHQLLSSEHDVLSHDRPMKTCRTLSVGAAIVAFTCLSFSSPTAGKDDLGIAAPDGFEVTLFADDQLAHDIYSLTLNAEGQVVVAGRGYVKILHDDNNDGRADRSTMFSEFPKSGAHGMCFVGNDLIATGDNLLMRLQDKDGDGQADGKPIPIANLKSPEHGANGIVQGPDGWFYIICGNDAGVGSQLARTETSPVKKPQAGAVVRFSPDFATSEIFAHGFRNPYDLAFNVKGHLFTVDADGERDQFLPWYTPTRLFDIQEGAHHGWVQQGWQRSWSRPECYFDNVERLVEVGRGSPTGVACYRHIQFPAKYRGGIFSACWTLGKVYHFPLTADGSTYASEKEVFLETKGGTGFAPVDLAVGPHGEMYVAIGGRGTQGGVFKISFVGDSAENLRLPRSNDDLANSMLDVLEMPQPLSAWSRAKWLPLAKKVGRRQFSEAAMGQGTVDQNDVSLRNRAVEILTEVFGGVTPAEAQAINNSSTPAPILARAIWSIGRSDNHSPAMVETVKGSLAHRDLPVQRAGWEALASVKDFSRSNIPWQSVSSKDRRVREYALSLAEVDEVASLLSRDEQQLDDATHSPVQLAWLKLQAIKGQHGGELLLKAARWCRGELATDGSTMQAMDAVRVMQLALGDVSHKPQKPDVYAGYTANALPKVLPQQREVAARLLIEQFPTGDLDLDREMARTLGMLQLQDDVTLLSKLANQLTTESKVQDDIHYLIVISRVGGPRTKRVTQQTAKAIAFLHFKLLSEEAQPSRNWPLRVGEMLSELIRRDPSLPMALVSEENFRLPEHATLAKRFPDEAANAAARKLLSQSKDWDDELPWTADMVNLISQLPPDESLPALRGKWHDVAMRDDILRQLARRPRVQDRQRFVEALSAAQPSSVATAAKALTVLGETASAKELLTIMSTLRSYLSSRQNKEVRQALVALLVATSGQSIEASESAEQALSVTYQPWFDWFTTAYPEQAKTLNAIGGDSSASWQQRLALIDWASGDSTRGEKVFVQRACAKCHSGQNRIGPNLAGAAGRYSNADLLAEIINPSRSVSPLYQTTRYETASGKVVIGRPVYASPDGTLVQTGADSTVRIAGTQIIRTSRSRQSLMPAGLLRGATNQEVADLFTYLKSLQSTP